MKNSLVTIAMVLVLLTASCRQEEYEFVGEPPERGIVEGSEIANLLFRTSLKDGSSDNVLDRASCISLKLPVTVHIGEERFTVTNLDEHLVAVTEYLQKEYDDDDDDDDDDEDDEDDDDDDDDDDKKGLEFEFVFPVTIILADYTEISIANAAELKIYQDLCQEENSEDEDIECVDFSYPLQVSVFNTVTENFGRQAIVDDASLNAFIGGLAKEDRVTMQFPVELIVLGDTEISVDAIEDLETILQLYKDDCEEDDNNRFLTRLCDDCSSNEFDSVWASCATWEAHKFKLNGENIKKVYADYSFEFLPGGAVKVTSELGTKNGSWTAMGNGNDVTLKLNLPGLPDFNQVWNLEEIKNKGDDTIDVRLYNANNELHIQSDCN